MIITVIVYALWINVRIKKCVCVRADLKSYAEDGKMPGYRALRSKEPKLSWETWYATGYYSLDLVN